MTSSSRSPNSENGSGRFFPAESSEWAVLPLQSLSPFGTGFTDICRISNFDKRLVYK